MLKKTEVDILILDGAVTVNMLNGCVTFNEYAENIYKPNIKQQVQFGMNTGRRH